MYSQKGSNAKLLALAGVQAQGWAHGVREAVLLGGELERVSRGQTQKLGTQDCSKGRRGRQ